MKSEKPDKATPGELAASLRESIGADHLARTLEPGQLQDEKDLARWGRQFGLALGAHEDLGIPAWRRLSLEDLARFVARTISPHPEAFREKAEAMRELEGLRLFQEAKRLDGCGEPWGRVVRLFWKDRKGREVMRTRGLHSCKHKHCPRCGKPRQMKLAGQMERVVELAKEWGFDESNLRFVTLTVPNGTDVPTLREEAHHAWAKLQRGRWWPGRVFGWFRGSEVITGKDGKWNLHLHVVVILWSKQISYSNVWEAWEKATGKKYEVDVKTLRDLRKGAKGRGTTRALHYITKYITKREDQAKLEGGPGGLAHLFSGSRGMRAFAMGGGCSVLRRMLDVLMPSWALQAERVMEDAELRDGRAPFRCEEVDPETGEVMESAIPKPYLDEVERERWRALAGPLWINDTRTVGHKAGPRGQFRRLGSLPMQSKTLTLPEWRKGKNQEGIRALVAGGEWKHHEWTEVSEKTGKTLNFSMLLPRGRYAWRPIAARVWSAMALDQGEWATLRRGAFRAHAGASVGPLDMRDGMVAIDASLNDKTRRSLKAAELWASYCGTMAAEPYAVWDDSIQAIRRRALELERPGLLEVESPALRQLRRDLESTF